MEDETNIMLGDIARAIVLLGNGDANTGPVPVGAIEGLSMVLEKGMSEMASALTEIGYAIHELAQAQKALV